MAMTEKKLAPIIPTEERYLDPTNDVAFKKIFSDSNRLKDFLNAVLRLKDEKRIQTITIVPQEELPELGTGRRSIFDIKCTDQSGHIFVVEMQNRPEDAFLSRIQCYASHTYVSQVEKGANHNILMPVIMLSITNKILFESQEVECINYHWNMETKTGQQYLTALSYVFIELPKFTKQAHELESNEDEWLFFFANWDKIKVPPETVHDPLVLEAYEIIERFNWTVAEYDTYFRARLATEAEEITITKSFSDGREEGREEGRKEGREEGLKEGREEGLKEGEEKGERGRAVKIARTMLMSGVDVEVVSNMTGLSLEDVKKLKEELKKE